VYLLLFISLGNVTLFAKENLIDKGVVETNKSIDSLERDDAIRLIDIAGRQRMLSQRIAKNYLYMGKNIAVDKATKQLNESIKEFRKNQGELSEMINDQDITNLLT